MQRSLSLTFVDRQLEADYRRQEFASNARWTSAMMVFGSLLAGAFVTVDEYLVPPDAVRITSLVRILVVTPIPLIGLVANRLLRRNLLARDLFMAGGVVLLGSMWTLLIAVGGPSSVPYHAVAMMHTLMFAFFLIDLPFRMILPAAMAIATPFIVGVYVLQTPLDKSLLAYGGVPAVLLISAVALYRYESVSRGRFIAQRQSELDTTARLTAEKDRQRWLQLFAGFLQHELRNAIAGIGSSLELVRRLLSQPPGSEYIDRAARSLQFMRRMLQQVAEATTLESALARNTRERVNVSTLVGERVADFCEESPERKALTEIAPDLHVLGNADSLIQLVDKILNNAVEHSDGSRPIHIRGARLDGHVVLEVANHGDELPEDCERLFQPFVSEKARSGGGNLGLGLYVARAVVSHHGGTIHAAPLPEAKGARIVVRLPAHDDPGVQGTSNV